MQKRAIFGVLILGLISAAIFGQQGFTVTDHPTTFVFGVFEGRTYQAILEPGKPPQWSHAVTLRFIQLDASPIPDLDPPVPPDTLSERATAIYREAAKVNDQATAAKLGSLYSEIAKKVTAGEIKTQATIAAVVKGATDMLLGDKAAAWKPTRDVFGAQWVKLAQEGGKDADFAELLNEASDGFRAAGPNAGAIDLNKILEIIRLIMELLKLIPQEGGAK
jgi:hypothetical protein